MNLLWLEIPSEVVSLSPAKKLPWHRQPKLNWTCEHVGWQDMTSRVTKLLMCSFHVHLWLKVLGCRPNIPIVVFEHFYNTTVGIHPGHLLDNFFGLVHPIAAHEAQRELFENVDGSHLVLVVIFVKALHSFCQPFDCLRVVFGGCELFADLIAIFSREAVPKINKDVRSADKEVVSMPEHFPAALFTVFSHFRKGP